MHSTSKRSFVKKKIKKLVQKRSFWIKKLRKRYNLNDIVMRVPISSEKSILIFTGSKKNVLNERYKALKEFLSKIHSSLMTPRSSLSWSAKEKRRNLLT